MQFHESLYLVQGSKMVGTRLVCLLFTYLFVYLLIYLCTYLFIYSFLPLYQHFNGKELCLLDEWRIIMQEHDITTASEDLLLYKKIFNHASQQETHCNCGYSQMHLHIVKQAGLSVKVAILTVLQVTSWLIEFIRGSYSSGRTSHGSLPM